MGVGKLSLTPAQYAAPNISCEIHSRKGPCIRDGACAPPPKQCMKYEIPRGTICTQGGSIMYRTSGVQGFSNSCANQSLPSCQPQTPHWTSPHQLPPCLCLCISVYSRIHQITSVGTSTLCTPYSNNHFPKSTLSPSHTIYVCTILKAIPRTISSCSVNAPPVSSSLEPVGHLFLRFFRH